MTEATSRILLALDLSPEGAAATRLAIDLARALEARVDALFVEDREILSLAAHPLAREVDPVGGVVRPVEPGAWERRLRIQAKRARRSLEAAAAQSGVRWSFRVVRGQWEETVRHDVTSLDWVALGRHTWTTASATGTGPKGYWIGAAGVVVTPRRELRPNDPTRVLYDGSPAAQRALRAATTLAGHSGRRLEVVLLGSDESERARLQSEVLAALGPGVEEPRWQWIPGAEHDPNAIRASLAAGSPSFLVVPVGGRIREEGLQAIVTGLDSPLLCVR